MESNPIHIELTESERQLFREGEYLEQMLATPGWQFVDQKLTDFVEEALSEMRQVVTPHPTELVSLHMRWQQRSAMADGLRMWIEQRIRAKQEFVKQVTTSGEDDDRSEPDSE